MNDQRFLWTFVAITTAVVLLNIWLVQRAYARRTHTRTHLKAALGGGVILGGWMFLHWALANAGVLLGPPDEVPPRALPYLALTTAAVVALGCSPVGRTLAHHLSWPALIGMQGFRVPLEVWLHRMWTQGHIPQQMTWAGWNLDVLSGIGAIALAVLMMRGHARRFVMAWNILGLGLLGVVVCVAILSAPTPLKQFDGPALTLVFEAPFNWIASVLVMTALLGHILVFRKLAHEALS